MCATICTKELLRKLDSGWPVEVQVGRSIVAMEKEGSPPQLTLKSNVYSGEGFIPLSVRQCVKGSKPFTSWLVNTRLALNEDEHTVCLDYIQKEGSLDESHLQATLEEFGWQADEWRLFLDDHGKQDLLPVYVKPN